MAQGSCAHWCSKWTTKQQPCAGCVRCTDKGCYFPPVFPAGFEGATDASFDVAYGSAEPKETGVLALRGNSRAYLVKGAREYHRVNLLGKTLRFEADVSKVPCGVNAALYFVGMSSGHSPDGYCDIQSSPSCTELDVFEANKGAMQATVHTQRGLGGDGTCNQVRICMPAAVAHGTLCLCIHCTRRVRRSSLATQWGCAVNWGNFPRVRGVGGGGGRLAAELFGSGASAIDTRHPFEVACTVGPDGALTVLLSQKGRLVPFFNGTSASNPVAAQCSAEAGGSGGCGIRDPPTVRHDGLQPWSFARAPDDPRSSPACGRRRPRAYRARPSSRACARGGAAWCSSSRCGATPRPRACASGSTTSAPTRCAGASTRPSPPSPTSA